ncbi:MAG: asparagine synthetase A [Thermofilaceae archaeon]|nr:asparagine synthetase A [Thermofilaceae archaeon]MCX8179934.1 asparagine synthetase A [Thermofilaceae archaeon]MDW8004375.1 asparagine synthetase A [Thermofilaceae archaeon]
MKRVKLHPSVEMLEKLVREGEDSLAKVLSDKLSKCYALYKVDTKYARIFKVQSTVLKAIREFLDARGFIELLPPIVGPVSDPGIRGAGQASLEFYGARYKLMSSAILYKQMMADVLGKIYFVSPNVRLEKPESITTGRHLAEFVQVDIEMKSASYQDAMRVAEGLLSYVLGRVLEEHWRDLEILGRYLEHFRPPFARVTYNQALEVLAGKGYSVKYGEEIPWELEIVLSASYDSPFFVTNYPRTARGFYDREDPSNPGILLDFDLVYPEGFGEAASGGEREYTYENVTKRMKDTGENLVEYSWYLDMLKQGISPSAGFGIGVERLTRYVCGLPAVWEARPYPKLPGIVPTP